MLAGQGEEPGVDDRLAVDGDEDRSTTSLATRPDQRVEEAGGQLLWSRAGPTCKWENRNYQIDVSHCDWISRFSIIFSALKVTFVPEKGKDEIKVLSLMHWSYCCSILMVLIYWLWKLSTISIMIDISNVKSCLSVQKDKRTKTLPLIWSVTRFCWFYEAFCRDRASNWLGWEG